MNDRKFRLSFFGLVLRKGARDRGDEGGDRREDPRWAWAHDGRVDRSGLRRGRPMQTAWAMPRQRHNRSRGERKNEAQGSGRGAGRRAFEKAGLALGDGKACLSPAIGRFGGMPIAWAMGASPGPSLASGMLRKASRPVPEGVRRAIRSGRGRHRRRPGRIGPMDKFGFVRSMPKKGRSPGNSAREGFFGAIKNEMLYNEGQPRTAAREFVPYPEKCLIWSRERGIEESLGCKSVIDRRREIGIS